MNPRGALPCLRHLRVRSATLVIRAHRKAVNCRFEHCKAGTYDLSVWKLVFTRCRCLWAYGRIGGCFDGSPPESRTAPSLLRFSRDFPPVSQSRSIRCGLILLAANWATAAERA